MRQNAIALRFCVALAWACALPVQAQTAPPSAPQPTFRADQFTDFVGINGSPLHFTVIPSGPFAGAGKTYNPQVFYDLGIRYYRTPLFDDLTPPDYPAQVEAAWLGHGVRPMLLIDPHKTPTSTAVLVKLAQFDPRSLAEIEGPNEVNNKFPPQDLDLKYGDQTDEAAGTAFMDDVAKAVRANPATHSLPLISFTAIFTDYQLAHPCAAFDFSNMHSYQGSDVPSASLLMNETRSDNLLPTGATIKPFVPTECGYNVEADKTNGTGNTGSLHAQSLNIPMLLAEYFRHGIKRAYLFAIQNADGYGLLESDLTTKRPSYFALKSLMEMVKDAAWDPQAHRWMGGLFSPRALIFGMAGAPPTVHTLSLQKKNGEYLLLIWNEVQNYNPAAHTDIVNTPVPVTLHVQTPTQGKATVLTQNDAGGYASQTMPLKNGSLQLDIPSSVMIVRLTPAHVAIPTPPTTPRALLGTATENSVHLSWQPPMRRADAAGYFVFRNGQFLDAVAGTTYDDKSAWVRPGLGYTYAVQAYDHTGGMSPRAEAVVVTPDRHPDLICTDVTWPKDLKAGDPVAFQSTLKNIGDGATPSDTPASLTFFVDGQYTSYTGTDGTPLAPGESRILTANGGNNGGKWSATPGAHILRVLVDDVDRVSDDRRKTDKNIDRSLLVDTHTPGLLLGAGDPAPGQTDLTAEGTKDWVQWGLEGKTGVNRMASGGHQISDLKEIGSGYMDATPGFGMSVKWSNGTPTALINDSHASLWLNGVGSGYSFTAPAGTREQVLRVYVMGINGAACTLTAHLSDGSAPDYVSKTFNGNLAFSWAPVPDGFTAMYTLRYRAAAANQMLNVTWTLSEEPNRFLGQARIQAVTLSNA